MLRESVEHAAMGDQIVNAIEMMIDYKIAIAFEKLETVMRKINAKEHSKEWDKNEF